MTSIPHAAASPSSARRVLADAIPGCLVRDAALVVGSAAFVGLAAQIAIPLPFTPVPVSGQTFAVLLAGAALGTTRGLIGMLLYLVAGGLGVPWFAEGSSGWAGASFGYIIGFVAAGALVGALAQRGWDRTPLRTIVLMVGGNLVIYALGVPWLMAAIDVDFATALSLGVVPFLIGDGLKVLLAAGVLPATWKLVGRKS